MGSFVAGGRSPSWPFSGPSFGTTLDRPSDIDVLVTFEPGGGMTFDTRVEMLDELSAIFGREVDLVQKKTLRNPFRRQAILTTKEVVYAA